MLARLLPAPGVGWPEVKPALARRVGVAVGGHHGLVPTDAQVQDEMTLGVLGYGPEWDGARRRMLSCLARALGVEGCAAPKDPVGADAHWPMMLLAGLTSVADWIASNKTHFPHRPEVADPVEYAAIVERCAGRALVALGWNLWAPGSPVSPSFPSMFGFEPRPLQLAAVGRAAQMRGPSLTLVETPMGEGKTEAALFLADRWIHGSGGQGLYVAMPTMATGNQMFGRVARFLKSRYPDTVVNLQLMHGEAILSEEFG